MAPIDAQARSATVTALTQVTVVAITRTHLETLMEQSDPLLNMMLRAMFARLRELQRRIAAGTARSDVAQIHDPLPLDERYRRLMAFGRFEEG